MKRFEQLLEELNKNEKKPIEGLQQIILLLKNAFAEEMIADGLLKTGTPDRVFYSFQIDVSVVLCGFRRVIQPKSHHIHTLALGYAKLLGIRIAIYLHNPIDRESQICRVGDRS